MEERNVQVLRMGGIYAGARNTVVAIRLPDDDYSGIVNVLAKIQPDLGFRNQDHALADLLEQPRIKQVLKSYCQADYWKRIWIVQEFAIGRRIDLLIGATLIDARKLEALFECAERMTGKSIEGAEQAWKILDIRRSREEGQRTDLFEILEMTQDSLCERRHDRVFGLLGLISDTLDFLSEPNYQIDPTYLASSMTRSYIERRSLDIIILAQSIDVNRSMQLPTWCPPLFWYDQYPPSRHLLDRALRHQEVRSYRWTHAWSTTGDSASSCTFEGAALVSPARRIGRITSLGSTWTDKDDTQYPCHDRRWAQMQRNPTRGSYVADLMIDAILDRDYEYKRYQKKSWPGKPVLESYEKHYLVEVFRSKHGSNVAEDSQTPFQRWIRFNRKFSVCGKTLEDHAERCRRTPLVFAVLSTKGFSYHSLKKMARKDMRMMCLDDDQYGIGWAAKGARLDDEVFLIPGCSVPLILRRVEGTENYNLIGDAIVIGVMEGEVWNATRAAHLVQVRIV
ncbi:hypothetical protein SLS60_006313 [Paraconiothyrium brasiliense]|uniref:Heterokaryon incompatibility domain-containing protein n=1 Tax=Paraconiothyrium brasiliense TaxID=300254 RepID=A0ABR3RAD4_9PLEO